LVIFGVFLKISTSCNRLD